MAAVLLWVWPPYLIWKSERAHGFYGSGLVYVCLVLLLVLRLAERRSRVDTALLGLVLGLGWWQTPQVVPIALPALLWLVWRRPAVWRDGWALVPTALLGALPWLVSNVEHDWWSFDIDSGQTPYPTRLRGFFSATFPMSFGLRVPFTSEWPLGPVLSGVVYIALAVVFVVAWRRCRSTGDAAVLRHRPLPVPLCALALDLDRGRASLRRRAPARAGSARGATRNRRLAGSGRRGSRLRALGRRPVAPHVLARVLQRADGLFVPRDFSPLLAELERNGPKHVFASYWPAYRLDFESRERIVAAEARLPELAIVGGRVVPPVPKSYDESRHLEYFAVVRADPNAGFVLLRGATEDVRARPLLEQAGYRRTIVDGFAIYRRTSR